MPFFFRICYENIEILNRFHGITCIPGKNHGGCLYKVRIHVRSNYVVGIYEQEKVNGVDGDVNLNISFVDYSEK